MLIRDEAPAKVAIKRHTCPFHLRHPDRLYAGCTCSTEYKVGHYGDTPTTSTEDHPDA